MKKTILRKSALAWVLFFLAVCFTNREAEAQIQVGLKLGQSFNTFYGDQPHVSSNGILSFAGGLSGMYSLNEQLAVQAELIYSQYGGSLIEFENYARYGLDISQIPFPLETIDNTVRINTLDVPVMVNYALVDLGGASLNVLAGAAFGFSMGARVNSEVTSPDVISLANGTFTSYTRSDYDRRNYDKVNVGGILGVELAVPVTNGNVSFTGRYRHGFTSVRDEYSYINYSGVTSSLTSGSLQFFLGYTINL